MSKNGGGLYKNIRISVKTLDVIIASAIAVLFIAGAFMISHNGFTVSFETNGGTYVESCKRLYGEKTDAAAKPTKDGYSFSGWYVDRGCSEKWDEKETVTESMTLYAGWK